PARPAGPHRLPRPDVRLSSPSVARPGAQMTGRLEAMNEHAEIRKETTRLKDRVALVTGGDRGLGLGIARAFAHEGARVCIANPHAESGEAAARRIEEDGGASMAVVMDVTDEAQVEAGVTRTVERWGGLDILVSNAGIQHIAPLSD